MHPLATTPPSPSPSLYCLLRSHTLYSALTSKLIFSSRSSPSSPTPLILLLLNAESSFFSTGLLLLLYTGLYCSSCSSCLSSGLYCSSFFSTGLYCSSTQGSPAPSASIHRAPLLLFLLLLFSCFCCPPVSPHRFLLLRLLFLLLLHPGNCVCTARAQGEGRNALILSKHTPHCYPACILALRD